MEILVIPFSVSSMHLFKGALKKFKLSFATRSEVESGLCNFDKVELVILDSRFQDMYGVHIFELLEIETQLASVPKLVIIEFSEIRKELEEVMRSNNSYIIRPPRVKYLESISSSMIKRKLKKLNVNEESQMEWLADAIDDIEDITRKGHGHFLRVKELSEGLYELLKNDLKVDKSILTKFAYLHDVNRTKVKNNILDNVEKGIDICEEDYLNVFCRVGDINEIVKTTMSGWGHFYLDKYKTYKYDDRNGQDIVRVPDIVAIADAYDMFWRKYREECRAMEPSKIVNELAKTGSYKNHVLEMLHKLQVN